MDIDMHYYGTYALARAGGLTADAAATVAFAAEYVDDSAKEEIIHHGSGAGFVGEATAHHPTALIPNNNLDDQRRVWVPFHFLPGGEGNDLSAKLICRKDSAIAQQMVAHHLGLADAEFALELLGITAHVYADTFAHYGFSGVSSRRNRVQAGSIELVGDDPFAAEQFEAIKAFFTKYGIQGGVFENFRKAMRAVITEGGQAVVAALGHGAVATYPDQPYLHWTYRYENADLWGQGAGVERDNATDFLAGSRALHGMFNRFAQKRPDVRDLRTERTFDQIAPVVTEIIGTVGPRERRWATWQARLRAGDLTGIPGEEIPAYDPEQHRREFRSLANLADSREARMRPIHRFQRAAALHRNYVLRDLLPANDIILV